MNKTNIFLSKIKLIFIFAFMLSISFNSQSQTVKAIHSAGALIPGQNITISIVFDDASGTFSFDTWDMYLNWNTDVLSWVSSTTIKSGLSGLTWTAPIFSDANNDYKVYFGFGSTLSYNNETIINLTLKYNGGSTPITFWADNNAASGCYIYDFTNIGDLILPNSFYTGCDIVGSTVDIISIGSGDWADGTKWDLGHKPNSSNSNVIINSSVITMNENANITGNLTINSGGALTVASGKTLAVSGDFTVKSDASFINNGTISGNVKVERFVTGNKWHLLASPIVGATSNMFSPALNANIPIYLRMHDEATNAWSYITDLVTPITPTQGYAIWADAGSPTINYTGTLNANASIPYTSNGLGWNLMGNPYTSALDWNTVTGKANISGGAFYCWNSVEGKYSVSDGQAGVNQLNIVSPYIIPTMQGFFVKATAAGSLGISTAKIHSAVPYYKSSNSLNDMVRLTAQRGLFKDEALVVMNSSATNNYDEAYDASKFFANNTDIPEIYTLAGSEKIAINKIGSFPAVVPVNIKMGVADNVTIKASDFANFDASVYIILEDMLNGTFQNLRQNPSYTFSATIGENAGRFNLHFSYIALGIDNLQNKNANIYSSNNTIYVNSSEKINDISVYNMLGQLIVNKAGNLNAMNTITVQAANAYYIVKVTTVNGVYTEKVYVK